MRPQADMLIRFRSRLLFDTQQVFTGEYVQPVGGKRGRVKIGRCEQDIEASRSSNHAKGESVLVVRTSAPSAAGDAGILPAPPSRPGPASVATKKLRGVPFSAPEEETLALRFLVSTGSTSSAVHPGVLNITQGTWSIDTGTTLDAISWGTLQPDAGRLRKYWILPGGGTGVGTNSIAASVSLGGGASPIGADGRTAIQLYNTLTSSVTEHLSLAVGRRFMQPVPDGGEWWYVEWDNGAGDQAHLKTIALDLSGGPTIINSTGIFTFPRLAAFSLTSTLGISAVFNGTVTAPVQCFRFPRDNSFTAAVTGFTPFGSANISDVHFVQSGRPDATLNSWGPKIVNLGVVSSFSNMSATGGPVVESAIPISEALTGLLESSDIIGDAIRVAVVGNTTGGDDTVRLMTKSTGDAGTMFSGPTGVFIEAVWIEG